MPRALWISAHSLHSTSRQQAYRCAQYLLQALCPYQHATFADLLESKCTGLQQTS